MTRVPMAQLQEWQSAVGRTQTRTEVLDRESLRRFAAAIGEDLEVERVHPSLGHWAFFLPLIANSELTADGASRGTFLPSIDLPRRMFAGATLCFGAICFGSRRPRSTATVSTTMPSIQRTMNDIPVCSFRDHLLRRSYSASRADVPVANLELSVSVLRHPCTSRSRCALAGSMTGGPWLQHVVMARRL
jgi:hydroxyacyl-ACP dehydratase HTD2-like protein with hotdog domain